MYVRLHEGGKCFFFAKALSLPVKVKQTHRVHHSIILPANSLTLTKNKCRWRVRYQHIDFTCVCMYFVCLFFLFAFVFRSTVFHIFRSFIVLFASIELLFLLALCIYRCICISVSMFSFSLVVCVCVCVLEKGSFSVETFVTLNA